jgi:hypothetical protein
MGRHRRWFVLEDPLRVCVDLSLIQTLVKSVHLAREPNGQQIARSTHLGGGTGRRFDPRRRPLQIAGDV